MTKYKRNCNECGKYYEGQGKKYCSKCYTPWNLGIKSSTGNGFKGHHVTIENKLKNSKLHKGKIISEEQKEIHRRMWLDPLKNPFTGIRGKDHPLYGIIPKSCGNYRRYSYISPFQGEVFLKMLYELAYVKYLDSKNIPWYYEPEIFPVIVVPVIVPPVIATAEAACVASVSRPKLVRKVATVVGTIVPLPSKL